MSRVRTGPAARPAPSELRVRLAPLVLFLLLCHTQQVHQAVHMIRRDTRGNPKAMAAWEVIADSFNKNLGEFNLAMEHHQFWR